MASEVNSFKDLLNLDSVREVMATNQSNNLKGGDKSKDD